MHMKERETRRPVGWNRGDLVPSRTIGAETMPWCPARTAAPADCSMMSDINSHGDVKAAQYEMARSNAE